MCICIYAYMCTGGVPGLRMKEVTLVRRTMTRL